MNEYLQILARGDTLSRDQASDAMHLIMQGKADPIQISGFLMGMRARGETVEELTGLVQVMRSYFIPVQCEDPDAIDVCGTGGDGKNTFNISTAAAFVCAGAGVTVAKHGNQSVSSRSGSADVLQALGVKVDLRADEVSECLHKIGIGFIFARHYHPAMRHVMPVRTALRARTAFNILGPLCNPASVRRQVIGAFDYETAEMIAAVMQNLDAKHFLTLYSTDGLDEASIAAPTRVIEYREGDQKLRRYRIEPEAYDLKKSDLTQIIGGDPHENASIIRSVLKGEKCPCRDVVLLNSALGLWVSDQYLDNDCIKIAQESIDSGAALERLEMLCEYSNRS